MLEGVVDRLPAPDSGSAQPRFALTIDDGASTHVVDAYIDFLRDAGLRATFFVTACYASWTAVQGKLAPMVDSGQVQLANHTWDHPSVTALSDREIAGQLGRTEQFLWNTYGVRGAPFFRPPYGRHNGHTDAITGELGFTRTVLWYGSLGDASPLPGWQILDLARQWFRPDRIVIAHANHSGVTTIYPQLLELIRQRSLNTVTLRDVFEA